MFRWTRLLVVCLLAQCLVSGTVMAGPIELYAPTGVPEKAHDLIESGVEIVGAVESVAVALDAAVLDRAPERLILPLLDGRRLEVERTDFAIERHYRRWVGEIRSLDGGIPGYVHLVDHGDQVTGILNLSGEHYQIASVSDGGHRLVRVAHADSSCVFETLDAAAGGIETWAADEPIDPMGEPALSVHAEVADSPPSESPTDRHGKVTVTERLDVLVVYPASLFDPMQVNALVHFVRTGESIANDIFARSKVGVRYHVTEILPLTSTPPSTVGNDVATVRDTLVDWLNHEPDEVKTLRDRHAADMVALFMPKSWGEGSLADESRACGIANLPVEGNAMSIWGGDFGQKAFTVHRSGCGQNDYTLGHELGHNLALRHTDGSREPPLAAASDALASNLVYQPWAVLESGNLDPDVPGKFLAGYHFTPLEDVVLTRLGGRFPGKKRVRLHVKGDPQPLADTMVWSYDQFRYFAPDQGRIRLSPDTTYTVLVETGDRQSSTEGSGYVYQDTPPFPRTFGPIRIEGSTAISMVQYPGQMPTNTVTDLLYGAPDIEVTLVTAMGCLFAEGVDDYYGEICHRVPYLSTSDSSVRYGSIPVGDATHDNAKVARIQAGVVADFRPNLGPVCGNDSFAIDIDTPLDIVLGDLVGNDTDPEGDELSLEDHDRDTAAGGENDSGHLGGFTYTPPTGFRGKDYFSYTVSDKVHGIGQTDTCTVEILVGAEVFARNGRVPNLTHEPQTVFFGRAFNDPVVIAQTPSRLEAETAVVRITDVRSDRFTMFIDEAPNLDGTHIAESVPWIVVEAGTWELDGLLIQAGRQTVSGTVGAQVGWQWTTIGYPQPFIDTPVVLSQVQTHNDPSWVKTRHAPISGTVSFRLAFEKEEAATVPHGAETVGWLAVEPGSAFYLDRELLAGRTGAVVSDTPYTISFGRMIASPRVFAAVSSYNGGDNAALRYTGLTASTVSVMVEEDTTFDTETAHAGEVVDYLVLSRHGELMGFRQ